MFVSGIVDEERVVSSKDRIYVLFTYKEDVLNYMKKRRWILTNKLERIGERATIIYETYMTKADCWQMMKDLGLAGWYENKTMRIY